MVAGCAEPVPKQNPGDQVVRREGPLRVTCLRGDEVVFEHDRIYRVIRSDSRGPGIATYETDGGIPFRGRMGEAIVCAWEPLSPAAGPATGPVDPGVEEEPAVAEAQDDTQATPSAPPNATSPTLGVPDDQPASGDQEDQEPELVQDREPETDPSTESETQPESVAEPVAAAEPSQSVDDPRDNAPTADSVDPGGDQPEGRVSPDDTPADDPPAVDPHEADSGAPSVVVAASDTGQFARLSLRSSANVEYQVETDGRRLVVRTDPPLPMQLGTSMTALTDYVMEAEILEADGGVAFTLRDTAVVDHFSSGDGIDVLIYPIVGQRG